MKPKIDWFLVGMVIAVGLAWLFPAPGARGGWMQPELVTSLGVALIFFLNGVSLSFASLQEGVMKWKIHVVVQGAVFLLFPLIGLGLMAATRGWLPDDLRLGLFYLCASPSTVSSSVALTAAAAGNVPAAIFNATISSLLGVVLTPLWMTLVMQPTGSNSAGGTLPFGEVIVELLFWLVLPLVLGQLCRPLLGGWVARHRRFVGMVDRGTILLLIYTSFCDSMVLGIWTKHGLSIVMATAVISLALFYAVFYTLSAVCWGLNFNREDWIATVFCGSKKSMATAVPMAQLMFGASPALGLILLPIMIYHPLQLVICGLLATRWRARMSNA
jgi:sodium/bile acid cotransporter 7